jgi:flavin-dependent dehydrogenase
MCGNGMAMAIHSAKIASDLVIRYRSGKSKQELLEKSIAINGTIILKND